MFWLGVGDLISGIVTEDEAEVIGLHFAIRRSRGREGFRGDFGEQVAVFVTAGNPDGELMHRRSFAHAGEGFAVLPGRFAPPSIRDAGPRHKVTFVGGIGEDFGADRGSVLYYDFLKGGSGFANAVFLPEAVMQQQLDSGFAKHLLEDRFGDMRFHEPGNIL